MPLPEDAQPGTLTPNGADLLVGAQVSSGKVRPRLFSLSADTTATPVPLQPKSPYAFLTRWLAISVHNGRITAVGGAAGGAHANTRWTTWTGTTAGVRETPQPFSTFGGYGAGSLVGSAEAGRGPALVGSWQGAETRLDGAVWIENGDRWVRQPSTGTALESTPDLLVGLRSVTGNDGRLLAPGSMVRLEPGNVSQAAAIWQSDARAANWARVDLPDADRPSEAVTAGCSVSLCLVAGFVHGSYALWRFSAAGAVRVAGLPSLPADGETPFTVPVTRGDLTIALVTSGPTSTLLAGHEDSWTRSDGPLGTPKSTALVGSWLYAVVTGSDGRSVLWRADVRSLG